MGAACAGVWIVKGLCVCVCVCVWPIKQVEQGFQAKKLVFIMVAKRS